MDKSFFTGSRIRYEAKTNAHMDSLFPSSLEKIHILEGDQITSSEVGTESKPGNLNGSCERDAEAGVLEFD